MNLSSVEKTYQAPIPINTHTFLEAAVQRSETEKGRSFKQHINFHKAIKGTVTLNTEPHAAYRAGGKEALINGISGSNTRYGDKEWLGFWGDDLVITVALEKETNITKIATRLYNAPGQWIYAPERIIASVYLSDGRKLSTSMDIKLSHENLAEAELLNFGNDPSVTTSKIELSIPSYGVIPAGQQGSGNKAWTFIDEIIIE